MYRDMNDMEREWIDKLLDVDLQGKDILMKQFLKAQAICEKGYEFISLKFEVKNSDEKYPYPIRVPIEMRAFQEGSAPVIFLLHIIDGLVNELEIFSADLSQIIEDNISLKTVEYEISEEIL
jgi:hypothetical protein